MLSLLLFELLFSLIVTRSVRSMDPVGGYNVA